MSKDGWIGSEQPEKNESREEQRRRMPEFMMAVMLLIAVFLVSRQAGLMVSGQAVAVGARRPVVVLDSGHGGNDPGKIGVDGSLEKEINLQIARRLKTYLEASDVTVVMTREDDRGLYEETDSSKKMADMKNRCGKIAEAEPDLVVSIHQNSYHQESVSGGQVFYYKTSERGKRLAEILQRRFDYVLGVNTKGNMFLTQAVAKQMIRQAPLDGRKGVIVNVSSCSSVVSSVNRGEYCVSKAGVSMLTTLYADRLAQEGILVHEVRPGVIATDMTSAVQDKYDKMIGDGMFPIARWGTPQDVANAVSALCSDKFLYTTGNYIDVDGGFHIKRL